jgi:eukaryotic-like serine/threonine-protein kinase
VKVPDVRGQTLPDAVAAIASIGLEKNVVQVYSKTTPGTVTAQSPAPNTTVKKGSKVRINVSQGPKPITVPDVTGQPFKNAESALKGLGFTVDRVDANSDTVQKGKVISEDPGANTQVPVGSKVTLTVSKGQAGITVPNVVFDSQSDASTMLTSKGFTVAVNFTPVTDPTQVGIVISQTPVGGTQGQANQVVTISVGVLQSGTVTTTDTTTTTP